MKTINFKGEELQLSMEEYTNGNKAIELLTMENEPYMVATINLGFEIPSNHVIIKDYSENEGIEDALREQGVIGKVIDTHYIIQANEVELLIDGLKKTYN